MTILNFIETHKLKILGLGFSSVISAALLSFVLFRAQADLISVFLVTLALTPLIYYTVKIEEGYDYKGNKEIVDLKHHMRVLNVYMILFLGSLIGFIFLYLAIPANHIQTFFSTQILSIGHPIEIGSFYEVFGGIILNNVRILFVCMILSLIYGAGALFILIWNSSVLAVVLGEILKHNNNIFHAGFSALSYFTYGVFEILAYFVAGLAGGIVSVAIIRHHYKTKKFYYVLRDSSILFLLAFTLLLFGAIIEALVIIL